MREIKFRVYDKLIKKIITEENVRNFLDKDLGSYEKSSPYDSDEWYPAYYILVIFDYFRDVQDYTIEEYNPKTEKRFGIMQYTGLKDKNGVEIYEGDIFEVVNSYEERFVVYVEYSEEYAQFVTRCNAVYIDNEPLGDILADDIEVIGNIYDNPELLEKEE